MEKSVKREIWNSAELEEYVTSTRQDSIATGTRISKKFKNSLDSDEEDDEIRVEKYNVLNPDEFEGQEESTIDHDGEIQITPFNMREELEEGYFDKEGTYIFKKSEDEINDKWLDDIDWVKVKRVEETKQRTTKNSESDDDDLPELNVIEHYKKMIDFMEPNETVQKAIRRLGGSKKSSKQRLKQKNEEEETSNKDVEKLQSLTELANDIINNGDMDIYQQTYEKLTFLIKAAEEPKHDSKNSSEPLDMFGDQFEEDESSAKQNGNNEAKTETSSLEPEVTWEFKWEAKEDAPVYGPHTSNEMLQWVQEGYFAAGVYVRQVGKLGSSFYSSKRIDFELYL